MSQALQQYFRKPENNQEDFARKVDRAQSTVSRWVNGVNPIPSNLLKRVSDITGIPTETLIE